MESEIILKNWKMGKTVSQISKEYMKKHNQDCKRKGQARITEQQAMAYVEPIIYDYEINLMRG